VSHDPVLLLPLWRCRDIGRDSLAPLQGASIRARSAGAIFKQAINGMVVSLQGNLGAGIPTNGNALN
jgi:hypothetical protein